MHKEFFDTLHKDHEEQNEILEKLKKTSNGASKEREKLFMKLKEELKPHMKAEEKAFYPVLKTKKEALEDTLESIEEHHVTEILLNELDKMEKNAENWGAKLSVLKELVAHHVEEEEDKIFKDAKQYIDENEMKDVLNSFKKEKERVKSSL